jgi:uncharacterized protein (TIGR02271 family)
MDVAEFTREEFPKLRNIPVYTADGEKVGHVGDAYYDEETERLECVAVAADGLGVAKRVIPVRGARVEDDGLHLPYGRESITNAPDADDDLDEDRYRSVSDYYRDREEEASVTRKEEELQVGKRPVEAGKVRVRKWVEEEPVELDVELRRETAKVTREQIDEPVSAADFREEEVEVPLHEEEAVVAKQTVAKERISVEKEVEHDRERIRDQVKKERVDVDDRDAS